MATIDQAVLLELDLHPHSTVEELSDRLRSEAHAVRRWLRAHEGWLVVHEAMGQARWRLSPLGERFLAALD